MVHLHKNPAALAEIFYFAQNNDTMKFTIYITVLVAGLIFSPVALPMKTKPG
jgi:hypothetical protein